MCRDVRLLGGLRMEVLGSGSEMVLFGGVMGVGYRVWGFGECMRVGGLGLVGGSEGWGIR